MKTLWKQFWRFHRREGFDPLVTLTHPLDIAAARCLLARETPTVHFLDRVRTGDLG